MMVKKIEIIDIDEAFKNIGKKISDKRKSLRKKYPGISKKLNINIVYLKYIEEGKIDKIPDHVPVKGFVKTYAKLLNVNIDDELSIVERNQDNINKTLSSEKTNNNTPSRVTFFYFIAIVIFLLLLAFLYNSNIGEIEQDNVYGLQNIKNSYFKTS